MPEETPILETVKTTPVNGQSSVIATLTGNYITVDVNVNYSAEMSVAGMVLPMPGGSKSLHIPIDLQNEEDIENKLADHPFMQAIAEIILEKMKEDYVMPVG